MRDAPGWACQRDDVGPGIVSWTAHHQLEGWYDRHRPVVGDDLPWFCGQQMKGKKILRAVRPEDQVVASSCLQLSERVKNRLKVPAGISQGIDCFTGGYPVKWVIGDASSRSSLPSVSADGRGRMAKPAARRCDGQQQPCVPPGGLWI